MDNYNNYQSSQSDQYCQSEFEENIPRIKVEFYEQQSFEDKIPFSNININKPQDQKEPSETIQEYLFTEEKLDASGKGIHFINNKKHNLINIKLLDLSRCLIETLPDDIIQMNNIQKLYLGSNQLCVIPLTLQSLQFLEILDVSNNLLSTFNLTFNNLKQLNLSTNFIVNISEIQPLDILCLQMNPIQEIPMSFCKSLMNMQQFEFDWFKYCKPTLPLKVNFNKFQFIKEKLINALLQQSLKLDTFISTLSVNEQTYTGTDYKERNLFCLAGINDEIGILIGLSQIIPSEINKPDYNNNTPMSVSYQEGKMRSVTIFKELGGRFSSNTIQQICCRSDLENLKYILGVRKNSINESQFQHSINLDSLTMLKNLDGSTPLHQLMMNFDKSNESYDCALLLLKYGTDPNVENYELYTPLEMAIKKGQSKAIKFAYNYNLSSEADFIKGRYFDFQHKSGGLGYEITHLAVINGNINILEMLISYNFDFFAITNFNKTPKQLATQSLFALKNLRKLEKRWLNQNILFSLSLIELQEKNVNQMKSQIEKNIIQRHHNMAQKFLDQEEIEQSAILESYNEFSLQVGSERSIRDVAAESAQIFLKSNKINQKFTLQQYFQMSEQIDQLPEIIKYLRNQNIELAINKIKNILLNDSICLSERLKYKIQLSILKFKLKMKRFDMKTFYSQSQLLPTNEYQFKQIKLEQRKIYFKEAQQQLIDINKIDISKATSIIDRQKEICLSHCLQVELKKVDSNVIQEQKQKLSTNLVYDLNNYAQPIFATQTELHKIITSIQIKNQRINSNSSFFTLINYEYLQQMRFKKKKKIIFDDEFNNIEKDLCELHPINTLPINQIMINNGLFSNQKRF